MWTKLILRHFKCFEEVVVPLEPLTFLSGVNAAGKSTIIQSLALLNQTILSSDWSKALLLNGNNVHLGTCEDVLNKTTSRNNFDIELGTKDFSLLWQFGSRERKHEFAPVVEGFEISTRRGSKRRWQYTPDFSVVFPKNFLFQLLPVEFQRKLPHILSRTGKKLCQIKYLGAERLGPRETYELTTRKDYDGVGPHGEYTANYLHTFGGDPAEVKLTFSNQPQNILKAVLEWMQVFFPGFDFVITPVEGANLVTLQIRTASSSERHRPQNVGYGITHVLPIITLCVGAKPGETILIENPETHLHPVGQSLLGTFLARTAAAGVQIIVESHSDHVLNGLRKAVANGILKQNEIVFNFVTANSESSSVVSHELQEIRCDARGRIKEWPSQFFDQIENDLLELP